MNPVVPPPLAPHRRRHRKTPLAAFAAWLSAQSFHLVASLLPRHTALARIFRARGYKRSAPPQRLAQWVRHFLATKTFFDPETEVLCLGSSHVISAINPVRYTQYRIWNAGVPAGDYRTAYYFYLALRKCWPREPGQSVLLGEEFWGASYQAEYTPTYFIFPILKILFAIPYRSRLLIRKMERLAAYLIAAYRRPKLARLISQRLADSRGFCPHAEAPLSTDLTHREHASAARARAHLRFLDYPPSELPWLVHLRRAVEEDGRRLILWRPPVCDLYRQALGDRTLWETHASVEKGLTIIDHSCLSFPLALWADADHFTRAGADAYSPILEMALTTVCPPRREPRRAQRSEKPTTVSIIVPVFNKAAYLEACLRSLLAQSYPHFELLLIDDGSSDASAEICQNFCRIDSRVHLILQPNRGASCARNRGLDIARGEAIYFSDADDFVHPELLTLVLPPFEKRRVDYAIFQMATVAPSAKPDFPAYTPRQAPPPILDPLVDFFEHDHPIVGVGVWHFLFRREALSTLRFVPGLLDEDVLFIYHFLAIARCGIRLPYTLYYYLDLQETLSRSLPRPELISSYDTTIHEIDRLYSKRPALERHLLRRILYPRIIRINWRRVRAIKAPNRDLRHRMQHDLGRLIVHLQDEGLLSLRTLSFHYKVVALYCRFLYA